MGWLTKRRVKKFIENPDDYVVVNPRFCEHDYELVFHKRLKKNVFYCSKCDNIKNDKKRIRNKKFRVCKLCGSIFKRSVKDCSIDFEPLR